MTQEPDRSAGGVFLALAIFAGVAIGAARGSAAAGVVAGIAVGSAIAILVWLRDRRRTGE